jgi:hypothetical protein
LSQNDILLAVCSSDFQNEITLLQNRSSTSSSDTPNRRRNSPNNRNNTRNTQEERSVHRERDSQEDASNTARQENTNETNGRSNRRNTQEERSVRRERDSQEDASKNTEEEGSFILPFLLGVIAGSIFTYFSLYFFAKKIAKKLLPLVKSDLKEIVKELSYQPKQSEYISEWSPAPTEKRLIEPLKEETFARSTVSESDSQPVVEQVTTKPLQEEKPTVKCLYFSIPDEQGVFQMNQANQEYDAQSHYYKIVFSENSTEGELFYVGEQHSRAIHYLDSFLKPVCDIENQLNYRNTSSIEFLKPGKVRRIGDSWRIEQKAKIRLL